MTRKQFIKKMLASIGYDPLYRVYFINRCLSGIRFKYIAFTKQEVITYIKKVIRKRYYVYS